MNDPSGNFWVQPTDPAKRLTINPNLLSLNGLLGMN
jgi:hypothetical protein